jgi:signal transduction histidine kinase
MSRNPVLIVGDREASGHALAVMLGRAGRVLCAVVLALATAGAGAREAERPRRVLMVHSFGSSAPPFTTHSTAFEETIKRELGTAVDLDEVSLDMARYAQPDMEEVFAEFLAKRVSRWQPDLVAPIGSPAGRFVAKYRDRIFPGTPVVYTGMDRRTLPDDAFADNATFVGESFDLKGLVEDMLLLDPETKQIVVIFGATPLERYWTEQFKRAFEPFAGRVRFTWVNDLSFEQIQDLVSKLPPHSFVLLGLFLRDATGVTYNADDALARLNRVSRAPINGMFQHQVGLGAVGGRLYQGELEGIKGAEVAARILRGEPASGFPPLIIGPDKPLYDWRELRRWGFDEDRLPPGSVVLFRQPTAWQRYRWHVLAAAAVVATQALLIVALYFQLRRRRVAEDARRSAEAKAQQNRAELAHVARVAALGELTATLAHELKQPLTAICSNAAAAQQFLSSPEPDMAEVREALTDISADTQRADEVIRRLRAMLKRGTPAQFVPADLNDAVRTVESILRADAARNQVTVDLDLAPDLPPTMGDPIQLQQVAMNLMLNAFAAMNQPGVPKRRLVVRTRMAPDGAHVRAEFEDSGVGIGDEVIDRLFQSFVTTKPEGLGMGLSICRTIVDLHRGKIRGFNNAAGGATFSLTLPACPANPQPAPHPRASGPAVVRRTTVVYGESSK